VPKLYYFMGLKYQNKSLQKHPSKNKKWLNNGPPKVEVIISNRLAQVAWKGQLESILCEDISWWSHQIIVPSSLNVRIKHARRQMCEKEFSCHDNWLPFCCDILYVALIKNDWLNLKGWLRMCLLNTLKGRKSFINFSSMVTSCFFGIF